MLVDGVVDSQCTAYKSYLSTKHLCDPPLGMYSASSFIGHFCGLSTMMMLFRCCDGVDVESGHYNQIIRSETRKLGLFKNEDFAGIHRIVNLPHLLWKLSFNAYHFTDHKHPKHCRFKVPNS